MKKAVEVSIQDVANAANVSIATVSRIVNNKAVVAQATRARVLQIVEDLGYQPNALARGLLSKQTHTIGVFFPKVSGLFSSTILSGVEDATESQGLCAIVCTTDSTDHSAKRTLKYLRVLAERRVDGILFATEALNDECYSFISKVKIPLIQMAIPSFRSSVAYVCCDDRQGGFSAVEYLIERGHRDIAVLCDEGKHPDGEAPRAEGYKRALKSHGIPLRPENIVYVPGYGFQQGFEGSNVLLERSQRPTAIFASSDEMAVGVISAAHQRGIRVPTDLSVIGYDDLQFAQMSLPPLTTVSQPLYEMGQKAVELLLSQIRGQTQVSSLILPHHIVERASVKSI